MKSGKPSLSYKVLALFDMLPRAPITIGMGHYYYYYHHHHHHHHHIIIIIITIITISRSYIVNLGLFKNLLIKLFNNKLSLLSLL